MDRWFLCKNFFNWLVEHNFDWVIRPAANWSHSKGFEKNRQKADWLMDFPFSKTFRMGESEVKSAFWFTEGWAGAVKDAYAPDVEVQVVYKGDLPDMLSPPNLAVDGELLGKEGWF